VGHLPARPLPFHPLAMSAVIPAHGSLPSPCLFRPPGQGDAASKPPHLPLARSETLHRAIATCAVSSPSLSSSGHVPAISSRQHAVKRVEQGRFNGCATAINRRISANLRECCRQKVASLLGKIPRARKEMLGVGKTGLTAVQTMPNSLHRQQNCLLLPTKFKKTKKASCRALYGTQQE